MRRTLLAVALLLLPTLVLAQAETTGRVTGTVLDEDRQPVVGAEILFESPALQGQRKSISDSNGRYLSSLLPPGIYTMTVNAPGKTPVQYTFRVGLGQTVPIDAVLKSGANLVEDVTVFAPASKMETTAGGENFNIENTINQLPVTRTGDYLINITTLAPNTSEVTFTANNIAISGAPSFDNSVLLDGADISDPFYSAGTTVYLEEAIEEVQVITNGASARYGRFQGGVINATTKSGGNTFDGTLRVDLSKQSWNSQTPFGEDQSDTLNKVYSATIGGPIMKDHLWFFLGGRTIPETSASRNFLHEAINDQSFTSTDNEDRFQGKLTGAINANHTIEAAYLKYDRERVNYDPFSWVAEPNAIIPTRTDPREFITAEYQGVLTDRMFISAQYAEKNVSIKSGGGRLDVSPFLEFFNGEYRAYANGWFDPNDPSVRDNESLAASMTHALTGGTWGDHTLEYGIQYVNSITAGDNRQSPTGFNLYYVTNTATPDSFADCDSAGNCTFDFDPSQWLYRRLKAIPGAGEQELQNLAVYVQDGWEVGKWRLDLGVRWENWEGNAISPAMTLDFDEFSPRLGVTYNVTADWQLQGSWGKYVARFNDNVANGVTGISSIYGPGILQEADVDVTPQFDLTEAEMETILRDDANWDTIVGFVDPLQPTTFFSDDISAPYATDLNLAVKRALPRNSGIFTATYTQRRFKDLLENYRGDNGTIDVLPPGGAPEPVDVVIWDNCGNCRRDYDALALGVDYRPSAKWDLGGNYTYARTRGNYEGEASGQPSIGSRIGDYERTINPAFAYPYGFLNSDIRHRARVWGNYRFDFGRAGKLTLGGILFYRSGASYSLVAPLNAAVDPAPDYSGAPSTYPAFFDGRGNNRYDGFWTLDTTFRYDISFWRDLSAYVKLDVQNITDEDSLISHRIGGSADDRSAAVPHFIPSASFGTPSGAGNYQKPRTYAISVGFAF